MWGKGGGGGTEGWGEIPAPEALSDLWLMRLGVAANNLNDTLTITVKLR